MLEIINYSKTYKGKVKAVDDLSLTVNAGDLYAFIGHNGAGKTTLIRSIAGALKFDSGDIRIKGVSILKDPIACKKRMAYIPDNPDLYEHLSGLQYLNFIADIFGISAAERKEQIKKFSDSFELTAKLDDFISSYSHGMKQKLAIISALIHSPDLMLLDEPFVGLDPKASFTLKQIMKEFCQAGGAIFFSTHVLEVAEKLCDRVALIKQGKLIADGPIEQVIGQGSLEETFLELTEK